MKSRIGTRDFLEVDVAHVHRAGRKRRGQEIPLPCALPKVVETVPQRGEKEREVFSVRRRPLVIGESGVFPVDVDAVKAVPPNGLYAGMGEGGP